MISERHANWATAALALALFGLYAPAIGFDFVDLDDAIYVTQNAHTQAGLTFSSMWWALTNTDIGWWHPVTWWSHMLDVTLWGPWAGGHHLTSVLLHTVNFVLAVWALKRLGVSPGARLVITALTFFHPTRVESVAWLSERKDVLFVFFGLLTVIAWTWYRARPSVARYGVVALLYVSSLASKTMLVTLPALLLLIDHWQAAGGPFAWRVRVLEKLPLLAVASLGAVGVVVTQHSAGAVQPLEALSWTTRLATVPVALVRFVEKTFWPQTLCAYYPRFSPAGWQTALASGGLVAVLVGLWVLRRRLPHLAHGVAWFFFSLGPVSGAVQIGGALMADRYLYWPQLGLFAGIVLTLAPHVSRLSRGRAVAASVATPALFALLTAFQLPMWHDSEVLFRSTLAVEPENPFMRTSLGLYLLKAGRAKETLEVMQGDNDSFGHSVYGLALIEQGDVERGVAVLDAAYATGAHELGVARSVIMGFMSLGAREAERGQFGDALKRFDRVLELKPGDPDATRLRARVLASAADAGVRLP